MRNQNSNIDASESRPTTEWNVQFDDNGERLDTTNNENEKILNKLKSTLKQRKRYKASCMHKIFTVFPSCMIKYKGALRK